MIPAEHGAWSFLGEPVALGLLVAPSLAGVAIGVAALAAFLARRPFKLLVSDLREGRRHPRTPVARRAFAFFALVAALAAAGALLLAGGRFLLALGLAAPVAAVALAFDLGRRSREAAAELTAPVALTAVAAAIALAGGWAPGPALGLWGILVARAVPSVLYVRARLRLERGESAGVARAVAAHVVAAGGVLLLATRGLAPWLAVTAIVLLALRAAHGLSPWRTVLTTKQIGVSEILFGALTVAAVAIGVALG